MNSKVSITKSLDHLQGTTNSLKYLDSDLKGKLSSIDQIVIKINFVTTHTKLATTPVETVETFLKFIQPFYKGEIVIAEEATGGDTKKGFQEYGYKELEKNYQNVRLLDLGDDKVIEKVIKYPGGEVKLPLSKTMVEAPFLVSITRAKTHDTVVVTLGIKNVAVGVITGAWGSRSQVHQGKFIHNILTEISKIVYPDFVIIDGTVGMEGNGPSSGTPIDAGWVVSSLDALAADSIAAHLMGFELEDIGYFNMIRDAGLGMVYPKDPSSLRQIRQAHCGQAQGSGHSDIEIVGDYDISKVTPFRPHDTFERQKKWK